MFSGFFVLFTQLEFALNFFIIIIIIIVVVVVVVVVAACHISYLFVSVVIHVLT